MTPEKNPVSAATEARRFLRRTHSGVLSTHSARVPGYPFGSIAPFVLDHDGHPVILISSLAEHTKNITQNPRVSLIAFDQTTQDKQAGGRLTLIGDAIVADQSDDALRQRYLRYLPQAEQYFGMHDFQFYRIEIRRARYIGGFGNINWISTDELCPPANLLAQLEDGIIEHMNADHNDALLAYCNLVHSITPAQARMIGMDSDGFDLLADGSVLRFDFDTPVLDAEQARTALVELRRRTPA